MSNEVGADFAAAVESGRLDLPLPGGGRTWERWASLAELAGEDHPAGLRPGRGRCQGRRRPDLGSTPGPSRAAGKEYAKETEAESDHHLHLRTSPARDAAAAAGLWRISLEAVDGWTLGADAAAGGEDDRGPFARLLGNP